MVLAWYLDNDSTSDKQKAHHREPKQFVPIENLYGLTGVEYFHFKGIEQDDTLNKIREERGYVHERALTCSKEFLGDQYEVKLNQFFTEHIHEEEILLVADGSGYFDVRDLDDQWIRISAVPGDMIVFPAGIYHRFTLDEKSYLKALSYSTTKPVLTAFKRPADDMEFRKSYLESMRTMKNRACA